MREQTNSLEVPRLGHDDRRKNDKVVARIADLVHWTGNGTSTKDAFEASDSVAGL